MEWGPVLPRGCAGCAVVPTAEKMPPAVLSVSAGARARVAVEAVGCVRRLPLRLASAAAADGVVPQCPAAARLLWWCLGHWDSTPLLRPCRELWLSQWVFRGRRTSGLRGLPLRE